jgi:hypothetical protein
LVVAAITVAIKAQYPKAYVLKVHGSLFQATGFPDLMCFVEGRAYGLEVKRLRNGESQQRARNRSTPLQKLTIAKLRRAGIVADTVLSPSEALAVIQSKGSQQFLTSEDLPELIDTSSAVPVD